MKSRVESAELEKDWSKTEKKEVKMREKMKNHDPSRPPTYTKLLSGVPHKKRNLLITVSSKARYKLRNEVRNFPPPQQRQTGQKFFFFNFCICFSIWREEGFIGSNELRCGWDSDWTDCNLLDHSDRSCMRLWWRTINVIISGSWSHITWFSALQHHGAFVIIRLVDFDGFDTDILH